MWFHATPQKDVAIRTYTAVYDEETMESFQTAIISAVSILCGYKVGQQQVLDSRHMLLAMLNDIRQSKFISVGFTDKLAALIKDEMNAPKKDNDE